MTTKIDDLTRGSYPDQFINTFLDELIDCVTHTINAPTFYVHNCKIPPRVLTGHRNDEDVDVISWVTDLPQPYFELPDEPNRFRAIGTWYTNTIREGCYAFGYSELIEDNTILVRVSFFDQRTAQAKLKLGGGNTGNLYVADKEVEYCDGKKHPAQENPLMEFFYGITEGQILAGTKGGDHEV